MIFERSLSSYEYNIMDYGATVCDELQTEYIQKAIDTCYTEGGGTVIIPSGVFYAAGLRLYSNVTLSLKSGAILRGSRKLSDYNFYRKTKIDPIDFKSYTVINDIDDPFSKRNNAIIQIINAHDVSIYGEPGSFIDGYNCFDKKGEDGCKGSHAISIYNSNGIVLDGYSVIDSGNFAHSFRSSEKISVTDVNVFGGHHAFEVRSCGGIFLNKCVCYTNSDCVKGYDNVHIRIRSSAFNSPTCAFNFGGNDICIERCNYHAKSRAASSSTDKNERSPVSDTNYDNNSQVFFRYYSDGLIKPKEASKNILVSSCSVTCQSLFELAYSSKNEFCRKHPLKEITFKDCIVDGIEQPMLIHGDSADLVKVTFEEVFFEAKELLSKIPLVDIKNFTSLVFDRVVLRNFSKRSIIKRSDGRVLVLESTDDKMDASNFRVSSDVIEKMGLHGIKLDLPPAIPNISSELKKYDLIVIEKYN